MEFKITVSKRIAQTTSTESLICGNDGDTLTVTFDDEWTNISAKTARLVWIKGGEYTYIDVPFTGTSCPLPAVIQAKMLFVGFFAGDSTENTLKTSTPAQIPCISSILDVPAEAFAPDVYRNILDIIANKVDKVAGKGLSTNDYTDDDKSFLEETVPEEIDRIDEKIAEVEKNVYSNYKNKVDKVAGKGLSTNDYTDDEKAAVAKIANKQDIIQYAVMPEADASMANKIVQYIGNTTATYTQGLFYKCVNALVEYKWQKISVSSDQNKLDKPSSTSAVAQLVAYKLGGATETRKIDTSITDKSADTGIPTSKAVKDYADEKLAAVTPSINESGNWVIGTADTGFSAKGIKGDKGDTGTTQVTPLFANSIEDLNASGDASKLYVLPDGYVYAYRKATTTQESETPINGTDDNPYTDNARFTSSGEVATDVTGWVITPYIDITKYTGTIKIKLSGVPYIAASVGNYDKTTLYKEDKSIIVSASSSTTRGKGLWYSGEAAVSDDGSCTLTIALPWHHVEHAADTVGFLRFCGQGTSAQSVVTITHTETVTANQWVSTGIKFVSGGGSADLTAKIAELNNEGTDPTTVTLLPSVVKAFYNSAAYSDDDYTTTHLEKITYPCRADIPIPYTVKWSYNENAMRTTVAVDTKAIGTNNAYTMRTYDATGLNKFPIYNLIPCKTYYYKVTHILPDGSVVEAKSGSFTTASEPWRLLRIGGTQNVRDLGGWLGLDNKKVKYGKIIRGASLSDTSFPNLVVTGKGRLALAELNIQAELNLGAIDNSTSIAANCAYKKIGYSNYAEAIISSTARANFKNALEWIVSCLNGTLNEDGLYQVQRNIYVHCQGGCDRTGTFVFLLLGLLGVSESDLAKEYELSSFSDIGFGRLRNTVKAVDTYDYSGLVTALKQYSGTTITDKFYSFATNATNADKAGCGISADTITSFRNLMLE